MGAGMPDEVKQGLVLFGTVLGSLALVAATVTVCEHAGRARSPLDRLRDCSPPPTPTTTTSPPAAAARADLTRPAACPATPDRQAGCCCSTWPSRSCRRCRRRWGSGGCPLTAGWGGCRPRSCELQLPSLHGLAKVLSFEVHCWPASQVASHVFTHPPAGSGTSPRWRRCGTKSRRSRRARLPARLPACPPTRSLPPAWPPACLLAGAAGGTAHMPGACPPACVNRAAVSRIIFPRRAHRDAQAEHQRLSMAHQRGSGGGTQPGLSAGDRGLRARR